MAACEQPDGGDNPGTDDDPGMCFSDLQQEADGAHDNEHFKDHARSHVFAVAGGWLVDAAVGRAAIVA